MGKYFKLAARLLEVLADWWSENNEDADNWNRDIPGREQPGGRVDNGGEPGFVE